MKFTLRICDDFVHFVSLQQAFVIFAQITPRFFYILNSPNFFDFFSLFSFSSHNIRRYTAFLVKYIYFFPFLSFASILAFRLIFLHKNIKKAARRSVSRNIKLFALAKPSSFDQRRKPLTISSSASFSLSPRVISLMSCSPAIFPIAAS